MTLTELQTICRENGLVLSSSQLAQLDRYAALLKDQNAKLNLISRKDEDNILPRHILHSLTLRIPAICSYDFAGKRVIDVGTGGGLPGIPLRIVSDASSITLLDSIQKKILACAEMVASLGLREIQAISGRAEDLGKQPEYAQQYDVVVSRAVAPLEDLMKWTRGLIAPSGTLFSLKGGDLTEEIKRTRRLSYVSEVTETPLSLVSHDEFVREEKKLIRVDLNPATNVVALTG